MKNKDILYEESKKAVQEGENNKSSQIVVYTPQEEMAKKKFKLTKNKKVRVVAGTLAFLILLGAIVLGARSCKKDNRNTGAETTVSYSDDELKVIYIDYETQKRVLKDSAYFYRDVIKSNGGILND